MSVSVRSRLMAGTAAVVTASTITVSAAAGTALELPSTRVPVLSAVDLTAFASPLLEFYDTIQKTNLYLFSIAEPPVTQFDRAGIIPDLLAAGFPIFSQYALNASDYVSQSLNYLFQEFQQGIAPVPSVYPGAVRLLTWAVQALPANLGYAAQQVFAGNLVGGLATLQFAIANPIQAALYQTLNAGLYALGGVGTRAAAVITAVAEWVPTTIRNLADDVTVVLNAAGSVLGQVAFGIQTLNVETIWNALVVGLLGTSPNPATPTLPDALINQTIGEGGRIYTVPGQPGFLEVPSLRQNLIEIRDSITDALATDVPIPADPPFPVSFVPYFSRIPTPWNPTPGPVAAAPVPAASVPAAQSATVAAVENPPVAVTPVNAAAGADAATNVDSSPIADGKADAVRPSRANRGADVRAGDASDRQSRSARTATR